MSSKILKFLVALANDSDLMSEYVRDPERTMVRCGLDANEVELLRSGDPRAIAAAASISDPTPAAPAQAPSLPSRSAPLVQGQVPVVTAQVPGTMVVYGPVYYFMSPPVVAEAPAVEPSAYGVGGQPASSGVALISPPPMTTFTHMIPPAFRPWAPAALRVTPFSPVGREGQAANGGPPQPPEPRPDGPSH